MDCSGNESCVIFVLLNTPQEGGLLPAFLALCFSSDNITPITAEHGMCLSAAGLPVSEEGHIETFHGLGEKRFHQDEHFSLGGLLLKGHLYFLRSFHSCHLDLQRGLTRIKQT